MTLIRVKDHDGTLLTDGAMETEKARVKISPGLLEDAKGSRAGRLLLQLLADIDYAGRQGKPVMILGKSLGKDRGFDMTVVVPVHKAKQMNLGPPPNLHGKGTNGVRRVA